MPTVDREGLWEKLAEAMLQHESYPNAGQLVPFAEQDASVCRHWLGKARALAGPLSDLLAQADTAERMEAERDEARRELIVALDDHGGMKRQREEAFEAEDAALAEVARLSAEVEKRDKALKPFADLAETWVVQTAAQRDELLTVSNGERMCGIKATAFVEARTVLTRTTGQPDPGAREGSV